MVDFPAIIEADVPAQVDALVQAMTLGQAKGIIGVDERWAVGELYRMFGMDKVEELLNEQYPQDGPDAYDPLRTSKEEEKPEVPVVNPLIQQEPVKEARTELNSIKSALSRLGRAIRLFEAQAADD